MFHLLLYSQQVLVQKEVSSLKIYSRVLQAIPAGLIGLFAGAWSDKNGRKKIFLLALSGYLIYNVIFLLNFVFFYELRAEWLLLECLQVETSKNII